MILLRNADVYTPEPLGLRHLLIAGERVVWLGKDLPPLPSALGVEEADLGRRRVIPGFVDGHVHLTGGGGEAGLHTRVPPLALTELTRGGVTTAVGVLGTAAAGLGERSPAFSSPSSAALASPTLRFRPPRTT